MKKLAILGASAALAAMPVVGVFAAAGDVTGSTDTLQITVEPTCSFTNANSGEIVTTQTYSDTVANGAKAAFKVGGNSKTNHVFNVVCNYNDGWRVTAAGGDLAGATQGNAHVIQMVAAAVPTAGSGTKEGQWSAALSGTGVSGSYIAVPTQEAPTPTIATQTAATDSTTFTVTYDAYVGTETAADTYSHTVVYALSNL